MELNIEEFSEYCDKKINAEMNKNRISKQQKKTGIQLKETLSFYVLFLW